MKVANSYASLLRGVSQQVPQERAEGQHSEQVNMLSDPINGLARRHGSEWLAETVIAPYSEYNNLVADSATWGTLDWTVGAKDYIVLYRKDANLLSVSTAPLIVYNKTDNIFLTGSRPVVDTQLDLLASGGVSAITAVGRFLYFCGNSVTVSGTSTEQWDTVANHSNAVVWVRGGAYGRTFTIKVRLQNGTLKSVAYTTPLASYQGTLTTSDIPATATDYTKQVNDRVNAYNSAVTAWIGTSSAAIQPSAIAMQLSTLLSYTGLEGFGITTVVNGSTIGFSTSGTVRSIEVDDGGDGSLIRGVADEVESADKVSTLHFNGKVVKVRGKNSEEAYYLRAVAKDSVAIGLTEVTWVEGAGVAHTITGGFMQATVVGSTFYFASSASGLTTISGVTAPSMQASTVGDADTSPQPFFVGRTVTYLGTYQSRLLVGSGGTLALSETDGYLNFYRTTVLTLPASDPFEMSPQGSDNDTIVGGVLYDQNLVVFGKNRQYVVSGDRQLSPTSANMPVMSSYDDTKLPLAAGGLIFYAKQFGNATGVYQIQPGQNLNSPESFPASSQLDNYMVGSPVTAASISGSPSHLFVRTTGHRRGLYVFTYLDMQDGRKMDSWSRWDFSQECGSTVGMSTDSDSVLVFSIRAVDSNTYLVVDRCTVDTDTDTAPYLDSRRAYAVVAGAATSLLLDNPLIVAAFKSTAERPFVGSGSAGIAALVEAYGTTSLDCGFSFSSSVGLTSPYMRDNKGKAILSGRLTVSRLTVALKQSGGMLWSIATGGTAHTGEFNGRVLGSITNIIGQEPVITSQHNVPVGRETRQYSCTLSARKWLPFTVTAVEWSGQFFNRVQRF